MWKSFTVSHLYLHSLISFMVTRFYIIFKHVVAEIHQNLSQLWSNLQKTCNFFTTNNKQNALYGIIRNSVNVVFKFSTGLSTFGVLRKFNLSGLQKLSLIFYYACIGKLMLLCTYCCFYRLFHVLFKLCLQLELIYTNTQLPYLMYII